MPCRDRLTGSTHSHGIAAPRSAQSYLCRRLICRPGELNINALTKPDSQIFCFQPDDFLHASAVNLAHIGESRTELIRIFSDQRARNRRRDLIRNHHQISGPEIRIDAARRIRQNQLLRPQQAHQPDRKYYIRHRIALIIMYSSLHNHNGNILNPSEDKSSLVSGDR